MDATTIFFNAIGILGSIFLLVGFYRVTKGQWSNKSLWYELDNVIGAMLIIVYQIYYHALVSVAVNLIWAGVAVAGLMVFVKRFRAHQHELRRKHGPKQALKRN